MPEASLQALVHTCLNDVAAARSLSPHQWQVCHHIAQCRTAALGGFATTAAPGWVFGLLRRKLAGRISRQRPTLQSERSNKCILTHFQQPNPTRAGAATTTEHFNQKWISNTQKNAPSMRPGRFTTEEVGRRSSAEREEKSPSISVRHIACQVFAPGTTTARATGNFGFFVLHQTSACTSANR
jgi:hypothetical protein